MKILVYGTGKCGEGLAKQCEKFGCEICAYIDDNSTQWGRSIKGKPVIPRDRICEFTFDHIVLATDTFVSQMQSRLIESGISRDNIRLYPGNRDRARSIYRAWNVSRVDGPLPLANAIRTALSPQAGCPDKEAKRLSLAITDTPFPFPEVLIFGVGARPFAIKTYLDDIAVKTVRFITANESYWGKQKDGVTCISPEQIPAFSEFPIIVGNESNPNIVPRLQAMGVDNFFFVDAPLSTWDPTLYAEYGPSLERVYRGLADDLSRQIFADVIAMRLEGKQARHDAVLSCYPQYQHPLVKAHDGDTVFDVGALWGDTALLFAQQINNNGIVYSFEPSKEHYSRLVRTVADHHLNSVIYPVNKGIWNSRRMLKFNSMIEFQPGSYRVADNGNETIETIGIDQFAAENNAQVNFIKMDIEGAELEALQGARASIVKWRPQLQISIYHKAEHLWQIYDYLHHLIPGYKFYLGHHSADYVETVLYARE